MKNFILLLGAILFLSTGLYAQNSLPGNFFYKKLDNGLEVLVIEDRTVPLATIEIAVKNGAFTEDADYDGLSHLYEHMFFKANKDIPSQEEFIRRASELGAIWNGTTSNERVNYFVTLNNKYLSEGMSFMNSAIRYPLFLQEEMTNENPVVDGEFQRNESNPVFHLFEDMSEHLWGDLKSRKSAIGNHDIILSATPEKMRIMKDKYYYPNNSLLAIAGDVDHEKVFELAEQIFGSWEPSDFDPFEKYPIPEFPALKESETFITVDANAKNPFILINWFGPDTRNDIPATYAADVFSFIVNQTSSKLQRDLVDAGLANSVNVSYQTLRYVGTISIFIVPKPDKIDEVMEVVDKHINMWDSDDYFTDEMIETAKTQLAIQDAYSKESVTNFIHTITYWWASADIDYYTTYVDNLNKVTREDMKNYVKNYMKGKPRVTGLLLSPDMQASLTIKSFEPVNKQ